MIAFCSLSYRSSVYCDEHVATPSIEVLGPSINLTQDSRLVTVLIDARWNST